MIESAKFIRTGWLRSNLYNLFGGIGLGILLCLFRSAATGKLVNFHTFYSTSLFSVLITLGVTNSILLAQSVFKLNYERVSFILVYYVASLLGMTAGIELSYFILSLSADYIYSFFHPQDMLFSSLVVIVICTISYAYHAQKASLQNRIRQKELDMMRMSQLKTQAELATLHSKINPHFLYNSLNSIASLIHLDPDKAESMTLKLSKLFRYSINQNQEDLVLVQDEVDTGNTYLDIEKVRFGDRINFRIDVDETLMMAKIPRFLIQPLVENALKHGLKNTAQKGELLIGIHQKDAWVEITIADNGAPFPDELQTGYGLQSTYDKLSLLYGDNYQISISNEPVKQIRILIPLKYD